MSGVEDIFTCYICKQIFEKQWSDDEAYNEAVEIWGEKAVKTEEMETLCDECYHLVMRSMA